MKGSNAESSLAALAITPDLRPAIPHAVHKTSETHRDHSHVIQEAKKLRHKPHFTHFYGFQPFPLISGGLSRARAASLLQTESNVQSATYK